MPSSPASPVATTMRASPLKISSSALTTSQWMVAMGLSRSARSTGSGNGESGMGGPAGSSCSRWRFPPRRPGSRVGGRSSGLLLHGLGLLEHLVDAADHVERLLGQVVAFAVDDHL